MVNKKLLTVSLAAAMLAVTASACGGNNNNDEPKSSNTGNSGNAANASTSPEAEDKTPVTFSYYSFTSQKDTMASDTVIGKELQNQTGVDWKMEFLVGDPQTKSGVMIASGDYPDVIVPEGEIDKLLDAGAFIPLDDLIEKYGPNIKRVYGQYFDKFRQADGKMYFLPFGANQGYVGDPGISQGAFWIQRSVLKEAGYPKIKTLDQYFDLIKQYQEKHPTVDGKGTIGFASLAGPADSFFSITNPAMHLAGYPNDGSVIVDMTTHEAKTYAATDNEKKWLQKLNQVNSEGLFDPETFTANKDQFLAKLTSGRVLGYFNYAWQVGDATNNLMKAGIDEKRYAPLPIVFDENTKDQYLDPPSFVNNRGIGISVNAKDPERIIKYWDNLLKEENQVLVQWGVKDQNYSVDANGRFIMNAQQISDRSDPEKKRSIGWQYFEYSWPRYGNNSVLADGNSYAVSNQPEVAYAGYTDGDKALLDAYGAKTFSEYFSKPDERAWYPAWSINKGQGTPEQIFEQKASDLQKKYIPKLVLAKTSDFDSVWNDYVGQMNKLDVKGYETFITKVVQDRINGKW
ncbi:ABC transporter substrate-binding protein [Paenibacillus lupini]|uniref:ABC transporter substrate-binding protein n=1 Tax=Paenibacillus lupini TaxID=1450204 RepID=UPI00141F5286|nr:ABC transporter substrate-binding protein [Paenibacillus lupini]NIK26376.1 putative aldouronate transport system substrate-binding protein [Paenibacillus lupini]